MPIFLFIIYFVRLVRIRSRVNTIVRRNSRVVKLNSRSIHALRCTARFHTVHYENETKNTFMRNVYKCEKQKNEKVVCFAECIVFKKKKKCYTWFCTFLVILLGTNRATLVRSTRGLWSRSPFFFLYFSFWSTFNALAKSFSRKLSPINRGKNFGFVEFQNFPFDSTLVRPATAAPWHRTAPSGGNSRL